MNFEKDLKEMLFGLNDLQRGAWKAGFERGKIEGRLESEREQKEKERKEIEKAEAEDSKIEGLGEKIQSPKDELRFYRD